VSVAFIEQYKYVRIFKRRRQKWYKPDPGTPEGRDAYKIAAKHEGAFARAFLAALREMFDTAKVERDLKRAVRTGSPVQVLEAVPTAQDEESPIWESFREKILRAYSTVMTEAGRDAAERMNKKFKTKVWFSVDPEPVPEKTEVVKAREDVAAAARGMMVPVNPYSVKWMEERSTHLIREISKSQREVVTDILADSFERGLRAEEVFDEIKENVGLTKRWNKAVVNRKEALRTAGFSETEVQEKGARYRDELLGKRAQMIARTETITAQAQGRNDAWRVAQESGALPEVQRRWLSAGPSGNPEAPCEICLELDGKTAKLNEPYESMYIGAVEMPGEEAHPGCRCTETLERVE